MKKTDSLKSSVIALAVVQASNYILPLVSVPYLARILGVENFGKVIFAQAFMMYFILLVEYGFSWSGTRKVAASRNDRRQLGKIFINVFCSQWLLVIFSAFACSGLVFLFDNLRVDAHFYALAFLSVFGSALFPLWFLQGIEKMRMAAFFQFFGKFFGLILLFLVVKNSSDVEWAIFSSSISTVLVGIFSLIFIFRGDFFYFCKPSLYGVVKELKEGWVLFTSRVYISSYAILMPLVLGWMMGPVALACYNVADKLRSGAQSLINPITQAFFPRISFLMENNKDAILPLLRKSAIGIFFVSLVASFLLYFFAEDLIKIIAGSGYEQAVVVLQWMSPIPFFVGVSNLLGVQIMIPLGMGREFNRSFMFAALLCLAMMWPMIDIAAEKGAAITLLITEFFGCALISFYLWRRFHGKILSGE
ncbi:flippase [Comamonas kerstersii]|uniref:Flippase n=1 Tax=Comamonas kerstersii TaxID=225992 RepID=A0A6A1QZM0_9BURK|nr:flippase [Comamonas kerstersii]KAB0584869.1 flippase [Comamonas kerstersii]QTW18791.1 flippase [Comamonas kerstersii]